MLNQHMICYEFISFWPFKSWIADWTWYNQVIFLNRLDWSNCFKYKKNLNSVEKFENFINETATYVPKCNHV